MKDLTRSRSIVAVSGGFDPPHRGHVNYFLAAKTLGDQLVVLLDSDDFVSGKHKVLVPQAQRADVLRELRCVDLVLLADGPDVTHLLAALRPDVYAVGPDHRSIDTIPEYLTCIKHNIKLVRLGLDRLGSSSQLVREYERAPGL